MNDRNKVEVIEFTDPVCTWCWGSEPILRALETKYGDQIETKFVMGGLVKDITAFYDSYNGIGIDPEQSNTNIARHWVEASERHGMPVQTEGFRLFSKEHTSTYPQNIAYKAAQMENQELADKFLRRIREASAAEARQTNRQEVLIELASEVGLDIGKFIERFADGSAEARFQEDLELTKQYGVNGFPAFLVRYGEKEIMIRSFQSLENFQAIINTITSGEIKEVKPGDTKEDVLDFIRKYGRVAPVEISMSLNLPDEKARSIIEELRDADQVKIISIGNGEFIEAIQNPMACDATTGVCRI